MSKAIRRRNDKVSPGVRAIAWKAQKRLHERLYRLMGAEQAGVPGGDRRGAGIGRASSGRSPVRRCCWPDRTHPYDNDSMSN